MTAGTTIAKRFKLIGKLMYERMPRRATPIVVEADLREGVEKLTRLSSVLRLA